jgi:hypothetical protein
MLLIEFPVGGETQYISDVIHHLEHQWKPYVIGFAPPSWRMDKEYGGMVRFGGGSITISNQLFVDLGIWPPPVQATPTAKYTATTEAASVTLFTHLAHLVSYNATESVYDIRETEWVDKLLDETVDYDGNDVALPRAFGTVTHVTPIRLADDDSSRPTYHLGGLAVGTFAYQIISITSMSSGAATKITTASAHGYSNGNTVNVRGLGTTFDAAHVISAASASIYTIPIAFAEVNLPINAQCYIGGALSVYDDGVPIQENVVINGDGTISLTAVPVNPDITISGTSAYTTVDEAADYIHTKLGITTYTSTYKRSPSPGISRWETSQQPTVDFLSGLCASFTHLCYIKADALVLVDMFQDNGSRTLTEYEFFKSPEYKKVNPLKKLVATWQTFSAETGFVNDDFAGGQSHYIKTTDHEVEESLYAYGDEVDVDIFHDTEANVISALICIRSIYYERDQATVPLPISGTLPDPGEKISWADSQMPIDIPGYIRACDIDYDFMNHEIKCSGPGIFMRVERMADTANTAVTGATTTTIDSFDMSLGKGAVWRYVIDDGSRTNMRVGIIQAVWDNAAGGSIEYMPDEHSDDIGTTFGVVSFAVDKSASTIRLRATSTGGTWDIHVVRTIIGASY